MVVERTLRVENLSNTSRNFNITPSFRFASDEASGAVKVQVRSRVQVSAGETRGYRRQVDHRSEQAVDMDA